MHIFHRAQMFQWGHDKKWTREIFEVYQPFMHLGVCKYGLCNLQGEDLKGTFYEAELQHVTYSPNQTFEVERELKCRREVENKKCWSSGKVGLTSLRVGSLPIQ